MFRTQAGRLHLVDNIGRVALADVTLIEDPSEEDRLESGEPGSPCSSSAGSSVNGDSCSLDGSNGTDHSLHHRSSLDFKLIMDDVKSSGKQIIIHLAAPTKQEKAAWITDITQVSNYLNLQ